MEGRWKLNKVFFLITPVLFWHCSLEQREPRESSSDYKDAPGAKNPDFNQIVPQNTEDLDGDGVNSQKTTSKQNSSGQDGQDSQDSDLLVTGTTQDSAPPAPPIGLPAGLPPKPPSPPPPKPTHTITVTCNGLMRINIKSAESNTTTATTTPQQSCTRLMNALNGKSFPTGQTKEVLTGGPTTRARCNGGNFSLAITNTAGGSSTSTNISSALGSTEVCNEIRNIVNALKI